MTAIYNPTAAPLTTITEPVDGEPRTAASLTQMTRSLADAVLLVQNRTDVLASLAALTAIATPADGMVRHVLGQGAYVFKTSATGGFAPFRLAADDTTTGGWLASVAHETTLTRFVSGNSVRARLGNVNPAILFQSMGGGFAALPVVAADVQLMQGSFRPLLISTDTTTAYGYMFLLDRYLVDGATLASATVYFYPAGASPSPGTRPRLAITRMARGSYGPDPESLLTTEFATDAGGTYVSNRSFVYTPDQNAVIDLGAYTYAAILFDHHGTGAVAANNYHGIALAMTIPDARRG